MHHTTRTYLIPISIGTLLCLAALLSVVWSVDPFTSGILGHFFFYLTLFLTLCGAITIGGITIRKKFYPGMYTEQLRTSTRQAILLSILILALLILQVYGLLFWWVGLTLILFIITVEIFLNS
ncbi:MAG TPA: hypothetical protein VHQ41_02580 [Patescibacteria group bacterium]|jgi:hypothetical protein|nr:hypothetical protein [Patescibacteria group bacterium]